MSSSIPNRLLQASSPYLLQHAYNPVDWYPWGKEALAHAAAENKLLVISIGYAACHWCHVMEQESFEDEQVALAMNRSYVSIKVDREERPDVDAVYMTAAYLTSGRGGWPLNVIALPDGSPVYAGTYFPKHSWLQVLGHFAKLWQEQPDALTELAGRMREGIRQADHEGWMHSPAASITAADTDAMAARVHGMADAEYGGLNKSPKFPMPSIWQFLLRHHYYTGDVKSLELVKTTLARMQQGGIYDAVGGGFARYSTDEYWMVPHFEKMLYDNAQLLQLYAEAYQVTRDAAYLRTMEGIVHWLQAEMQAPEGGFYSSLDADSEGAEGRYYIWTQQEIEEVLGNDAAWFCAYYSITAEGNWEGVNVLHNEIPAAEICRRYQLTNWPACLDDALARLAARRKMRPRPALDDKQLAAWNALAVKGLAAAGMAAGRNDWINQAVQAMQFIQSAFYTKEETLLRSYKDGVVAIPGFLDDYACCMEALLYLYQARPEEDWLLRAETLMQAAISRFYHEEEGVFYYTDAMHQELVVRTKELSDNVIPASNSIMAFCLHRLGLYTGREAWTGMSARLCLQLLEAAKRQGAYHSYWGMVYLEQVYGIKEIHIAPDKTEAFFARLRNRFSPDALPAVANPSSPLQLLQTPVPAGHMVLCHRQACSAPMAGIDELLRLLAGG